jgi:hypothetical protein
MEKTDGIAEAKMKLRQLENRVNRLMQAQKTELRKKRARRLIERGAILESMVDGAESLTNEQIKSFLSKLTNTDHARRALSEIAARGDDITQAKPDE